MESVEMGAVMPISIVVMSLSSPEEAVCDVWRPGCDLNKEYNLYEIDLKDGIVISSVKQIPVPKNYSPSQIKGKRHCKSLLINRCK